MRFPKCPALPLVLFLPLLASGVEPANEHMAAFEPFVGEWRSDVVHEPSVVERERRESVDHWEASYTLGGNFFRFKGHAPEGDDGERLDYEWTFGWIEEAQLYHGWYFDSAGTNMQITGVYHPDSRTFVWEILHLADGLSSIGMDRVTEDGKLESSFKIRADNGEFLLRQRSVATRVDKADTPDAGAGEAPGEKNAAEEEPGNEGEDGE